MNPTPPSRSPLPGPARGRRRLRRAALTVTALGVVVGTSLAVLPAPADAAPALQAPLPRVLQVGASGPSVKQVQQALIKRGVTVVGGADGVYGSATRQAVVRFQRSRGLSATGKVDAATAAALGLGGSSSSGSSISGLKLGARGPAVAELQRRLIAAGVTVVGGADGVFGAATQRALKLFQRWNGLKQTGRADSATVKRLPASAAAAPQAVRTTSTSSGGSGSVVGLRQGARGSAVKKVQQALARAGIAVRGGADGVFGPATKRAVVQFQRRHGITANGKVTSATAKKLGLTSSSSGAGSGSSSSYVGLKQGARGAAVKKLQQALMKTGIVVRGGADGVFGPATTAALKAFQSVNGIRQTGVLTAKGARYLGLTGSGSSGSGSSSSSGAGSGSSSSYVGLKQGARGTAVKKLQQALMRTGIAVRGGADGVFGPATTAALKAFQSVNGIRQTGVLTAKGAQFLGLTGSGGAPSGVSSGAGYAAFGERGDRVRALQRALVNAGIPLVGGVDGSFGGATASAIMEFQRRRGLSVTGKLDSRTAAQLAVAPAAAPPPPSTNVSLQVFPVQGRCWFGDTWLAPRGGGRTHQGLDIIAASGKLLYAAFSGTVSKIYVDAPGSRAGNGVRIARSDGTYITYLHMKGLAKGIRVGTRVSAGQVIGQVGNTGNSATPHLHFEIHPRGGAAINPYPIVKRIDACHVTTPRR